MRERRNRGPGTLVLTPCLLSDFALLKNFFQNIYIILLTVYIRIHILSLFYHILFVTKTSFTSIAHT